VGGAADFGGAAGALLVVPGDGATKAREAMLEAGAVPGDAEAWETVRVERGRPRWGLDFDETTYPQEAGLEATAVSFSKGCYLGQEVVFMLEKRGHVKRKLARLHLETGDAPARGARVVDEAGTDVGSVTSAVKSPTYGGSVALAMVKRAQAEPGRALRVGDEAARVMERDG
jgi:folate-binding protein YgfZ